MKDTDFFLQSAITPRAVCLFPTDYFYIAKLQKQFLEVANFWQLLRATQLDAWGYTAFN